MGSPNDKPWDPEVANGDRWFSRVRASEVIRAKPPFKPVPPPRVCFGRVWGAHALAALGRFPTITREFI
jgi:hypothetical protein